MRYKKHYTQRKLFEATFMKLYFLAQYMSKLLQDSVVTTDYNVYFMLTILAYGAEGEFAL